MNQHKKKLTASFITLAVIGLLLTTPIPPTLADIGTMQITNLAGNTLNFTEEELLSMPKTYAYADLFCFGYLVTTGNWGGITLRELLSRVDSISAGTSIQFFASDGYKVTIPISLAMQPDVIIAYEKDDQALDEGLRLILPEYNGAVWIAHIVSIKMSEEVSNYPEYTGVAGAIGNQLGEQTNPAPTATPSPNPVKPQPTTQPTPTPNIQAANPENVTHQFQPTPTPQTENAAQNQQTILFYAAALAAAIVLTTIATVNFVHKRKRNP